MEYRPITDDFSVSGQISADQISTIKAAGFKSIICNRPDHEQAGQPTADEIREAAEEAGLTFRHIPVISGQPATPEDVAAMAAALDEMEGPVFAYCRSGARSTNLFIAAQEA